MPNPVLEAALAYARKGWPVIPCRQSDKTPHTDHGVHDSSTDADVIKKWWERWPRAAVAIDVGGAGMLALDFDVKHGKTMAELIASVEKATGEKLKATNLRQRSPSGGEHWFYALDRKELVPSTTSPFVDNVDVRSHAGYVLAAPTPGYTWLAEGKPPFRDNGVFDLALRSVREKHKDRDTWIIEPDLPENIDRCVDWLKNKAQVAVEGSGGERMAYATAAMCKSFGISPELAFDLMWEHWNPRCEPPWGADELGHFEQKIANGYSYNTSPPGNMTAAYRKAKLAEQFKPIVTAMGDGVQISDGRFRFVDRAAIEEIAPPEWLLDDCLPANAYALLVAAARSFKTFIALDMALTIATGGFMGDPSKRLWTPNKCGRVLYVLGEGRSNARQRIKAWETMHNAGVAVDNLVLGDPVPHPDEKDWVPFVKGALEMSKGEPYRLVVLDTIGRSMQGRNVNAQEDASLFTLLVQAIQRDLGAAVLGLAHVGHDSKERAVGSQVWDADPDTIIVANRASEQGFEVALSMRKQKDAPEWEAPRGAKLATVGDSLAVVKGNVPTIQPKGRSKATDARTDAANQAREAKWQMVATTIDKALAEILAANPAKAFATKEMAETIVRKLGGTMSSDNVAKTYLKILRETGGTNAFKAYDPARGRYLPIN